jgi:rod shape-determining protein MreB and related proteins
MALLDFLRPIVYAKLEPELLTVREIASGRSISEPPLAAITRESKRRLIAVGEAARVAAATQPVELLNPFKHPRTLLSDFTLAEQVFKSFVKRLFEGRLFAAAPLIVLHPRVNPEGGFTQIEIRALKELAIGAGASKAVVWQGRDLADHELKHLKLDAGGEVLE